MGLRNVLRARQNTGLPQQLAGARETDGGVLSEDGVRAKEQKIVGQVELNICDYNTLYCKREREGGGET